MAPSMNTLSFRTLVRNAAAVFSECYGAVTHRAAEAGCSRQTVYEHARQVEQRLQPVDPPTPRDEIDVAPPAPSLDQSTRRRLAVTAFAMGISTRLIEDLLRVIVPDNGPDHATIARWVAAEAKNAKLVLQTLDEACIANVQTLAVDEIFLGDDRPWSASNRRA
jgi:hypothetical protein